MSIILIVVDNFWSPQTHNILFLFLQTYFIDVLIDRYVEPKLKMLIFGEDAKYKKIGKELDEKKNWPPTSKSCLSNLMRQTELGNAIEVRSMSSDHEYATGEMIEI